MVGTATRAPPASSSSAKSSPAGPWYRQLSTWADVTSISRSASHTPRHVDHDPHGERRGLAATAVEHLAVVVGQRDGHRSGMMARAGEPGRRIATCWPRGCRYRKREGTAVQGVPRRRSPRWPSRTSCCRRGPGSIVWDALALSMPVAILVGVRHFQPDRRLPWLFLAAGLGAFVVGDCRVEPAHRRRPRAERPRVRGGLSADRDRLPPPGTRGQADVDARDGRLADRRGRIGRDPVGRRARQGRRARAVVRVARQRRPTPCSTS